MTPEEEEQNQQSAVENDTSGMTRRDFLGAALGLGALAVTVGSYELGIRDGYAAGLTAIPNENERYILPEVEVKALAPETIPYKREEIWGLRKKASNPYDRSTLKEMEGRVWELQLDIGTFQGERMTYFEISVSYPEYHGNADNPEIKYDTIRLSPQQLYAIHQQSSQSDLGLVNFYLDGGEKTETERLDRSNANIVPLTPHEFGIENHIRIAAVDVAKHVNFIREAGDEKGGVVSYGETSAWVTFSIT